MEITKREKRFLQYMLRHDYPLFGGPLERGSTVDNYPNPIPKLVSGDLIAHVRGGLIVTRRGRVYAEAA